MMARGNRITTDSGDHWCPLWFLGDASLHRRALPGETRVLVGGQDAIHQLKQALLPPPVSGGPWG